MKAMVGFGFFMLFLGGYALVHLNNVAEEWEGSIPTAEELSVSAWRPSHVGEMVVDDDSATYVQFEADGSLGGNGGCNRFFTSYHLDGNKIQINPISLTRKACPEPIMSFEKSFVEALQLAKVIVGADTHIALRNERGEPTVRFDAIDRQDAQ
jgi:putative lipoprotein